MPTHLTVLAADLGKLLLRLTVGVLVGFHGVAKIIAGPSWVVGVVEKAGMPGSFGYLVYVGEVIAPLLLIIGLWTRAGALIVAINMAVAVYLVGMKSLFTLNQFGGWALELEGLYFFAALAIALIGSGRYALRPS